MSDDVIDGHEMPRVQHGIIDRPDGLCHEESGGLPHTNGDATACWCEPDVMTPCTHCDAAPGETPEPNREAYLPPCEHCNGEGMMAALPPFDQYDTVVVAHYDR